MPEAPDTIDAAVEALSSPTTVELLDDVGVRGFDARDLAAYAISAGGGGGGLARLTQTANVTTDPDTFIGEHVFDLGGLTIASIRMTLLSLDPDGESIGSPGGVYVSNGGADGEFGQSVDGITYGTPQALIAENSLSDLDPDSGGLIEADQFRIVGWMTPRYIKVVAGIFDGDSFNEYAGANHPTAEVRIDVEYLG